MNTWTPYTRWTGEREPFVRPTLRPHGPRSPRRHDTSSLHQHLRIITLLSHHHIIILTLGRYRPTSYQATKSGPGSKSRNPNIFDRLKESSAIWRWPKPFGWVLVQGNCPSLSHPWLSWDRRCFQISTEEFQLLGSQSADPGIVGCAHNVIYMLPMCPWLWPAGQPCQLPPLLFLCRNHDHSESTHYCPVEKMPNLFNRGVCHHDVNFVKGNPPEAMSVPGRTHINCTKACVLHIVEVA